VEREGDRLASLRSRPVLLSPDVMITQRHDDVERFKVRSLSSISAAVVRAADQLVHLKAQVRALSPQKTLDRGYAVVQLAGSGTAPATHRDVVRHPSQAPAGTGLTVRVAGGRFTAQSTGGQELAED
jgi:exodeoxyribonuclease VII large subunit